MYLDSKPHTIKGFKFKGADTNYPEWFKILVSKGKAYSVIDPSKTPELCHITMYDDSGNARKAYKDEWVCVNVTEKLFPLSNQEVEKYFNIREEED